MEKDVEWYTELLYAILPTLFPICYPYILLYSYSFTKNLTPQLSYSYLSHFLFTSLLPNGFCPCTNICTFLGSYPCNCSMFCMCSCSVLPHNCMHSCSSIGIVLISIQSLPSELHKYSIYHNVSKTLEWHGMALAYQQCGSQQV